MTLKEKINTLGKRDIIAYPTLCLFTINSLLLINLFLIRNFIPYIMYLILSSIYFYINFTPFHESSHRLIASSPYNYLNDIVGRASSIIYGTSYVGWRFLHNLHHKFTNHDIDPDNFYNSLSEVIVKGAFLDVIYLYNYMKHIHTRPFKEIIESLITYGCIFSFYGYLIYNNLGMSLFLYYILPVRFALLYASIMLDYNAHHNCKAKENDSILSTNKVSGFFIKDDSPLLLSLFTQNQNYHNIHHLYPYIPFYKYQNIWNDKDIRKDLIDKGTNEIIIANNMKKDVDEMKETLENNIRELKDTIESTIETTFNNSKKTE